MTWVACPGIGMSPRFAGTNFHCRTACTAASSNTGWPLDRLTWTESALPSALTWINSTTLPSHILRSANAG